VYALRNDHRPDEGRAAPPDRRSGARGAARGGAGSPVASTMIVAARGHQSSTLESDASPSEAEQVRSVTPVHVLITDGEQRAALAIVRSLGRAGYRPFVCSTRGGTLAGASRYSASEAAVPDPLREPAAFALSVQ